MDINWPAFSERLRVARKKIVPKMSQEALAALIGVQPPSVSRWETGKDRPEAFRIPKICKALGVAVQYFEMRKSNHLTGHAVAKVSDAFDFLGRFGNLKPGLRDLVLALVFDDQSYVYGADEADWPKWLTERLSARSK